MNQPPRKAVIIGAGIAGPTLAIALKRAGIQSTIYERRALEELDAGFWMGLGSNGMNALQTLEIDHVLDGVIYPTCGIRFQNAQGREIGVVDSRHDHLKYGAHHVVAKRADLHERLREEAQRQEITVEYRKKLVRITQDQAGVTAHFEDGTSQTADLLIGADGINSATRHAILPGTPANRYSGLINSGGFSDCPAALPSDGMQHLVFGHHAFFGYTALPTGEVYYFSNVPEGKAPDARALDSVPDEHWIARLLDLHGRDPFPIPEIIRATVGKTGKWPQYEMEPLERWHVGRVCLIGDAAHAPGPSAGQGASLALEDAVMLARCLRDYATPVEAFSAFQFLRKPRTDAILKQSRRNGSQKIPHPVFGFVRDLILPYALKQNIRQTEWMYAYRTDWEKDTRQEQPAPAGATR